MREHSSVGIAGGRSGTLFIGSVIGLVVTLLSAASPASAETRGYVISWFATATNNPDFVQNCPEAAKDPDRVKFVSGAAAGGRRHESRRRQWQAGPAARLSGCRARRIRLRDGGRQVRLRL